MYVYDPYSPFPIRQSDDRPLRVRSRAPFFPHPIALRDRPTLFFSVEIGMLIRPRSKKTSQRLPTEGS